MLAVNIVQVETVCRRRWKRYKLNSPTCKHNKPGAIFNHICQ